MIIGMDLSSRSVAMVGLPVTRDCGPPIWQKYTVPVRIKDRAEILGLLYAFVTPRVFPEDHVYVEAPVLAGKLNIQSTIKVAAAYGAVLAAVASTRAVCTDVAVSSWKLATVGRGNAAKSDVASWLYAQHPDHHTECAGDQDLMDATCIALYGVHTERSSAPGVRERPLLHQAS